MWQKWLAGLLVLGVLCAGLVFASYEWGSSSMKRANAEALAKAQTKALDQQREHAAERAALAAALSTARETANETLQKLLAANKALQEYASVRVPVEFLVYGRVCDSTETCVFSGLKPSTAPAPTSHADSQGPLAHESGCVGPDTNLFRSDREGQPSQAPATGTASLNAGSPRPVGGLDLHRNSKRVWIRNRNPHTLPDSFQSV